MCDDPAPNSVYKDPTLKPTCLLSNHSWFEILNDSYLHRFFCSNNKSYHNIHGENDSLF